MLLPEFTYLSPGTLPEACSLLAQYGNEAAVLAGGTDLLVKMKERQLTPHYLIGLKNIDNLDFIKLDDNKRISIGAMTTLNTIAVSPIIRRKLTFLALTADNMANQQIRNMGTIGGNLCNAAPSADTAPPLIASGANAVLTSPHKTRTIALEEFFTAPGQTVRKADEVLGEIQIPVPPALWGGVYFKLSQRSKADIAAVGVAAAVTLSAEGKCTGCRIVLGAVAPTPLRAKRAEQFLLDKVITNDLIAETSHLAAEDARPISDVRSSAEYRQEMVAVLTRRALAGALEEARQHKDTSK
ncbi:FAD binding domain-containing protein [Chloroflexota bacterium]